MRWRQRIGFLVAVCLWAHGLSALFSRFEGQVIEGTHTGSRGSRLATTVFAPAKTPNSRPLRAVVLCHAPTGTRRHMEALGRELARRGFLAVTFDYGGHGDSEDRPGEEQRN